MKLFSKRFSAFLFLVIFCFQCFPVTAQKRFYIAPDDHTDYFWVADDVVYRQAFLTMTDYYLNKMDATQNNPSDQQMRWHCDGSLWMWEYERNRNTQQFQRFINRIQDGHLSVPLNALVLVNGGAPTEAVLRGMYYPGLIERRYGVRFPMAIAMENQTQPFGLSSLWAGAGAKYSWKGVCGCASEVSQLDNRDREIYYCGGRDGSRVLMKWHSLYYNPVLSSSNKNFGGYSEAYNPLESIIFAETNPTFLSRYPYPVVGAFGRGWDDLQYTSDEFVTVAQQHTNSNRRIIVSNQEDFFRDFEANYSNQLETHAASYGNEWDTLVASMAEVSARVKRSLEKLRAADAMATLVSLNNPAFMNSRITERDKAMLNFGLYFEHDWTADGPVSRSARANWSRQVEGEITAYVDRLYNEARAELAKQISRTGTDTRFFVFNPLSWSRSDYADIPFRQDRKVNVVDLTTGLEVPSQIINYGNRKILRILAENVPSVGYKVYQIRNGSGVILPNTATVSGNTIENNFYRITLAGDGAITSLVDKTRGNRELVRNINSKVLNDLGGNRTGSVIIENAGPVSVTLRAVSSSPLQHVTRVTLYRNSDRIEINNQITQNFSDVRTWSYSLEVNSPDIWHEEVGAVIRAKLLANGGHYSPKNARYDWLTMNHFADLNDGANQNFGITISNADAYFMKLGNSTPSVFDTNTPQINILAGGQIDGSQLGIPNQGGDNFFTQRFALRTHNAFNQTEAMKFSLEHQNPFVTEMIDDVGNLSRPYPERNYSFLNITNPNVLLWTLKPAEDGISRGIITRVWNQSNATENYTLGISRTITSAEKTTHIETSISSANSSGGVLNANINQQQIQTHLLRVGN